MPQNEWTAGRLEGVIWDLDNTLYRFEDGFEHLCNIAAARAAMKGGAPLSEGEAIELSSLSYQQYGYSCRLFIERYGMDREQLHYDFHDLIDERLIRRSLDLIGLFEKTGLRHALVTHSSGRWARRALSHIGLAPFFPEEAIFPAEDVAFRSKAESREPFERALSLLGLAEDKVAVVEDVAANLRIPHEMGLATVLVHYGKNPDPMPGFVGFSCNNAADFLRAACGVS